MQNAFDVLKERGFIAQVTDENELRDLFENEKISFYTGYDPTADSLHVGHLMQLIAMRHMQLAGHRPVVLIGDGTTMIGDPSGRTDMRKMLSIEDIRANAEKFKEQMSRFIDFSDDKAILAYNADWLMKLEYIPFLREIGADFSVNRMLTAECYKSRMEKGLTFLEFNYMIMQAYDFYKLNKKYNCKLECGGDDQWSNILAGTDLIRRKTQSRAYGLTFTLLTTSDGKKMGKTMGGAVWLDRNKTTPYEFFQYWRNIEDSSVEKCLGLLTFLPMEEVKRLGALEGSEINKAKETLAYEVTKIVHGKEDADKALEASKAIFASNSSSENAPTTFIDKTNLDTGIDIVSLLKQTGLAPTSSEAKRLIDQGGILVNDEKISDKTFKVDSSMLKDGLIMIKKGKKTFHQVKVK
ncbi:tyrosine--tRNA ligase [Criibacterium bergeronii]|uniref:Tyrosine--tRNA ligase n=1 Tax=Criibacterium bergeronii TaxID=1871336 RepID=A0A552UXH0_9FIRM|nr:tyrosine--tRNA ligase [Criibacterium bergeronii]TRW22931.1 tyrosine--tRNA ligase [Criibacterium bergeronii]